MQIRVIRWDFGAVALMRSIGLFMRLRILRWWLSHAEGIMMIRGRENALFSLFYVKKFCRRLDIRVA